MTGFEITEWCLFLIFTQYKFTNFTSQKSMTLFKGYSSFPPEMSL